MANNPNWRKTKKREKKADTAAFKKWGTRTGFAKRASETKAADKRERAAEKAYKAYLKRTGDTLADTGRIFKNPARALPVGKFVTVKAIRRRDGTVEIYGA